MIKFLCVNRIRCAPLSVKWFKTWLKRIYWTPTLISVYVHGLYIRRRGGEFGTCTVIDRTYIPGNLRKLSIGDYSYISKDVVLALHSNIKIGSFVAINSGVKLLTGSHDVNDRDWKLISKSIVINDYAWLATGALILPGVEIGKGAVIGAGAVVRHNVPDYAVVIGNPGRVVGYRLERSFRYNPVSSIAYIEAWIGKS